MKASNGQNAVFAQLVPEAERFARHIFSHQPEGFTYHSLAHTALVAENARSIAHAINLPTEELTLLLTAAWLHDLGIGTIYVGHEQESCKLARKAVTHRLDDRSREEIEQAILATKIPQHATNRIGELLCDADLLYMGGTNFQLWSDRLRLEHEKILGRTYSNAEWLDFNIAFVRKHEYYTPFVRERYAPGLEKNLKELERRRARLK